MRRQENRATKHEKSNHNSRKRTFRILFTEKPRKTTVRRHTRQKTTHANISCQNSSRQHKKGIKNNNILKPSPPHNLRRISQQKVLRPSNSPKMHSIQHNQSHKRVKDRH